MCQGIDTGRDENCSSKEMKGYKGSDFEKRVKEVAKIPDSKVPIHGQKEVLENYPGERI